MGYKLHKYHNQNDETLSSDKFICIRLNKITNFKRSKWFYYKKLYEDFNDKKNKTIDYQPRYSIKSRTYIKFCKRTSQVIEFDNYD